MFACGAVMSIPLATAAEARAAGADALLNSWLRHRLRDVRRDSSGYSLSSSGIKPSWLREMSSFSESFSTARRILKNTTSCARVCRTLQSAHARAHANQRAARGARTVRISSALDARV